MTSNKQLVLTPKSKKLSLLAMDQPAVGAWRPPRDCDDYWTEFKHCKSLTNCFHHYYAYGTSPSCQQWKEDYHSCKEWEKHRAPKSKKALQTSERNRVAEQNNFTPVWTLRQEPPRDWHMPLNQDKPQDS
uniref:Synaptic plasticity regulator PANTS n=2 Tax=Gasterosteus aculeatus aculeatus TaxID=481459 RepID=G3NIR6_GASAC